jgi:hypothetical protein
MLLYHTAEWERLKGNEGRETTGRRMEKRDYKKERNAKEMEKRKPVNKEKIKIGEDCTAFSVSGVAQPFLSVVLYVKKGIRPGLLFKRFQRPVKLPAIGAS